MKLFLFLLLWFPAAVFAQQNQQDSLRRLCRSREVRIPNRSLAIVDCKTPRAEIGRELIRIKRHPTLDSLLTPEIEQQLLAEINYRCDALGKDTLLTSDVFYVMRPYIDWLHHEDPHYRIYMPTFADTAVYRKKSDHRKLTRALLMPAFSMLNINDTLLIDRSLDPQFRRGDQILAINSVPADEYLKYNYPDRHILPVSLMARYHYSHVTDRFRIALLREGQPIEIETAGAPGQDILFRLSKAEELDQNIRTYADARCGYIAMPEFFFNNSRLIRIVHKAIRNFREQGYTNIILDLRRNPGGYGHAFDKLLSIFIDKPVVDYCTGQRIRVTSTALQDYKFLKEEQLGQFVSLPDDAITRSFKTDPKLFIPGMTYYVLVGSDTGSIASSFVNMLQYHGAAQLVGEPLLHNALKFGEEADGQMWFPTQLAETSVSMVEIDECTRRSDEQVVPDISIPAVAAEYLSGQDAILDKLLERIKNRP